MKYSSMQTPAFLLDLDVLENNIKEYQRIAAEHNKQLWPMIKTHKSTEIAGMQAEEGAEGFLAGTLDECEALAKMGIKNIMYAYPVAGKCNISRVCALASVCNFYICLDSQSCAELIGEAAEQVGIAVQYLIIIDSGLHRFGVSPKKALELAKALKNKIGLRFAGISTHPGHAYASSDPINIQRCSKDECAALETAAGALKNEGFECEIISTGSTPTYRASISNTLINMYHPGNYVFNDVIQIANGTATQNECALTVLSTILSHPCESVYICDAGSKCLGLDLGAHGNDSIKGFGLVLDHPELTIISLSEEVGKLKSSANSILKIGDKIEIIPNHTCPAANLTGYLCGMRKGRFIRFIAVDMRGNSKKPLLEPLTHFK